MSFELMTWAVRQELPVQQKMVLLMLANRTNQDTGRCDPSHKRLSKDCGMSPDSVKRAIGALSDAGLLRVIHRSHDGVSLPNQYLLCSESPSFLQGVGANSTEGWVLTAGGVGADSTTKQEPKLENKTSLKATVQPAAARSRFEEFWSAYPNKKGRQDAEKRWKRDRLDAMADQIMDHVRLMQAEDDGWRRGYVPMGSTYLNQARWTDVPQEAPRERSQQAAPSKGMQAIMNLQASKNERVDANGDRNGLPAAHLPWARQTAGDGPYGRNGSGLDVSAKPQPRLGSDSGRPTFPKDVLDHDV